MESGSPPCCIAKRLLHMVRVVYYMLRKGISKKKLMMDLHLLLKRGKLAGKAFGHLITSHHHHHHHHEDIAATFSFDTSKEVEFSCSNTPNYFHAATKRKHSRNRRGEHESFDAAEIAKAFEMLNAEASDSESSAFPTPSPMLGIGWSPKIRGLRVTDSPFLLREEDVVNVGRIDKEAEDFIKKFYEQLRRQQLDSAAATPELHRRR